MIQTFELIPGVVLRCFPDDRFKQACLSMQIVRPMNEKEAAVNSLIPAVLLRGTENYPELRAITLHLDDLYGAAVGTMVRRVGDYQTTGLVCGFMEDKYAMDGDEILAPMVAFLEELCFRPLLQKGAFCRDFVESEKKNLIAAIEAQRNDKRTYASNRLFECICKNDPFGLPRLGTAAQAKQITPAGAYTHYQRILKESRIDLFYVGACDPAQVAALLMPMFQKLERSYTPLPGQTPYNPSEPVEETEKMDVSQGRLGMGFTTDITIGDPRFAAMQVCNTVFGAGMISKLFMVIREKMSLCYDIGSGYHSTKGIMSVTAGIDFDKEMTVRQEVLNQLKQCQEGNISQMELESAKQSLISQLRTTHDSASSIESYYGSSALSGLRWTPEEYIRAIEQVTAQQAADAAKTLKLHTVYFLKGVR